MDKNNQEFASLYAYCPKCQGILMWNIPLFETLVDFRVDQERKNQKDVFGFNFDAPELNLSPSVPIPVVLDLKQKAIVLPGWCERCNKLRMAVITPERIAQLLSNEGSDSDA